MSKHTPGPWTVFNSGEHGCSYRYPGIDAGLEAIIVFGDVYDPHDWQGVRGATVEEAHANARLIASARSFWRRWKACWNWPGSHTGTVMRT